MITTVQPVHIPLKHISFFDNTSRSNIEVQIRTKEMDDIAEIGPANPWGTRKDRKKKGPEGKQSPMERISILMMHTKGE